MVALSPTVEIDDSLEAFQDFLEAEGCSDGLPAVPPTPERVAAMIAASGRDPTELIAVFPPRQGAATVEKIAVNAVMAGCRPEYFPVVLEAVRACGDLHMHGNNTTTNCPTTLVVINGPARHTLGVNFAESCFGIGGRANATIGRAVRLVQLNIAGALPGVVTKSLFGQPGRYTLCIGEWDERNPWEPLHVQRGFSREDNCVTVGITTGTRNITDLFGRTGEDYLTAIAHTIAGVGGSNMVTGTSQIFIVLCPDWAAQTHKDGFKLADVREFLWEHTRLPLSRFAKVQHDHLRDAGRVGPNDMVPLTDHPDKFVILVAGGSGGLHAYVCEGFGRESITRPFTLAQDGASV